MDETRAGGEPRARRAADSGGSIGSDGTAGASPVRIAVIGQGFARSVILPCLRQVGGARVVGLAGRDAEKLRAVAAEFAVETASTDYREALARSRPDLVIVATPPYLHAAMAIEALEMGCHILCEKPMAVDAGETRRMLEAARARPDRLALVDHELRFLPARVRLRELVTAGALGRVLRAEYRLRTPLRRDPERPWSWWSDRDAGGGILGAIGSHAVDALRHLLGEVSSAEGRLVTVTATRRDPESGEMRPVTSDDIAEATLRLASGAVATLRLSAVESRREHLLSVSGTQGVAQVEEQGPLRVSTGAVSRLEAPEDGLPPSSELGIPDTDWARAFLLFAREIVAAIRRGGAVPGAATFEDGHRVQRVLDAVRRSSESGAPVPIEID